MSMDISTRDTPVEDSARSNEYETDYRNEDYCDNQHSACTSRRRRSRQWYLPSRIRAPAEFTRADGRRNVDDDKHEGDISKRYS